MVSTVSDGNAVKEAAHANSDKSSMPRILVVDDSRVIRNAAQKMLGSEFDVITAQDGDEAWEYLEIDHSIRVVFTDLTMPGLDGYALLRKIRTTADAGIQSLPVIVVTGAEDSEAARMRVLELGATDFIAKPFSTVDLVARARAHATYQRITQQLLAQTTLDTLTGLANKAGFLDRLQQDIAYARRHQRLLSLVRMEIDDFRTIFLKHGKAAGERLLMQVSRLLRASIRKEDTASRISLGGFALSLPAGEHEGIERMLERFRADVVEQTSDVIDGFSIRFRTAILDIPLDDGPSAQDAFDQCQAILDSAQKSDLKPIIAAATSAPTSIPMSPAPEARPALSHAAASPAARKLRLDPILDQLEQGHPQPAKAGMPLILNRLLPLLRLLSPTQRTQLMRFLQELQGP
jgi:two-component system cell cycle response regulator